MLRAVSVGLAMVLFGFSPLSHAACRSYHYDHDGNPHTAMRLQMVCEPTTRIRRMPVFVVETDPRQPMTTRVQAPRHIALPPEPRRCGIPSVYQLVQYHTKAQCMTE